MSLRDMVNTSSTQESGMDALLATRSTNAPDRTLKSQVHQELLRVFDLSVMEKISEDDLRSQLASFVDNYISEKRVSISLEQKKDLVKDIQNEVMGLGPLEDLLSDTTISDILVNNAKEVYVERKGKLDHASIQFDDDTHLLRIIDKIVSRVGRRIDESSPMVDARLPDGSRVNAIIPPLALDGPVLSIRRFSAVPLELEDIIKYGTLTKSMGTMLSALVKTKTNLLISGGTGSGKTTLLNILSGFIPEYERVITIEDAAELRLRQPHIVRLETRPPNIEGHGEVNQRALVRNSLRMRPDRVVIGEVRGAEVIDMLQAMNTGHEGSMSTIHANTPRDALNRLENMVGTSGINMPIRPMRQQIVSAITAIIQVARLSDGKRKITSIHEITGMEGDTITSQEIFYFQQTGLAPDGSVQGRFRATGIRPRFAERLAVRGAVLSEKLFDPDYQME